jgi:hypothetical protein
MSWVALWMTLGHAKPVVTNRARPRQNAASAGATRADERTGIAGAVVVADDEFIVASPSPSHRRMARVDATAGLLARGILSSRAFPVSQWLMRADVYR